MINAFLLKKEPLKEPKYPGIYKIIEGNLRVRNFNTCTRIDTSLLR
jgi:hypothetical protein